jgi:uncharacterized membrane protein
LRQRHELRQDLFHRHQQAGEGVKRICQIIGAAIVGVVCVILLPLVIVFAVIASVVAVIKAVIAAVRTAIKAKPDSLS